ALAFEVCAPDGESLSVAREVNRFHREARNTIFPHYQSLLCYIPNIEVDTPFITSTKIPGATLDDKCGKQPAIRRPAESIRAYRVTPLMISKTGDSLFERRVPDLHSR